ncbi:MAG TPA: hypothetical protein VGM18_15200 [Candidatus Sulfotelmatobacter sp.]|jgi:hypothetical protein
MKKLTTHDVKTTDSNPIEKPCVAVKVSPSSRKGPRKLGILKGKLAVGPEFFEPLPPDELAG